MRFSIGTFFFLTIGHKNGKNRLRDEGFSMCLSPTPLRSLCMKLTEIVWTRNFHFLKRCSLIAYAFLSCSCNLFSEKNDVVTEFIVQLSLYQVKCFLTLTPLIFKNFFISKNVIICPFFLVIFLRIFECDKKLVKFFNKCDLFE